jgi:hypothetical protein
VGGNLTRSGTAFVIFAAATLTGHTAIKPRRHSASLTPQPSLDHKAIDALYGLEPVFEPSPAMVEGAERRDNAATQFSSVQCPYCGECFEVLLDLSAGASSYIEDCQICCQPIQLGFELDANGALLGLTAQRAD